MISQDGEVVFEKAYGKACMQLDVSNSLDTKFHIASVTKMFIAMASLIAYEKGLININERPGKYIDELNLLDENIKIHHLLSHTSGLNDIYGVLNIRFEVSKLILDNGSFLSYLANQKQLFNPGEKWQYCSTGFIMMAYILERVTGLNIGELFDNYFFKPLNMNNTGLDNPRKINHSRAYGFSINEQGEYVNTDNDKLNEIRETAAGELYSTVGDLEKWCNTLLKRPFVSKELLNLMFTPYAEVDWEQNQSYGYGWFLNEKSRYIVGGTPGFRSDIWQFPDEKVNVIMLWNFEKVDSQKLFHSTIKPFII